MSPAGAVRTISAAPEQYIVPHVWPGFFELLEQRLRYGHRTRVALEEHQLDVIQVTIVRGSEQEPVVVAPNLRQDATAAAEPLAAHRAVRLQAGCQHLAERLWARQDGETFLPVSLSCV